MLRSRDLGLGEMNYPHEMILKLHHELEDFIVEVRQTFVPVIRVDSHGFRSGNFVVSRKLGGRRANSVHQASAHEHFTANAGGQVLHVDIAELGEYIGCPLVAGIKAAEPGAQALGVVRKQPFQIRGRPQP